MPNTGNIDTALEQALQRLGRTRAAVLYAARELRQQGEKPLTSEQLGRVLLYQVALSYAVDDVAALALRALHPEREH